MSQWGHTQGAMQGLHLVRIKVKATLLGRPAQGCGHVLTECLTSSTGILGRTGTETRAQFAVTRGR